MKKIVLAAVDLNFAIGWKNQLPWHGSQHADMRRFKELTMGFPIIMGRKTYESLPKRPLPGRRNLVLTRQLTYSLVGAVSFDEAFRLAEQDHAEKVFIIGGAEIYLQAIPFADELDLTMIRHRFPADTFFPRLDAKEWTRIDAQHFPTDSENQYPYSFLKFKRRGA